MIYFMIQELHHLDTLLNKPEHHPVYSIWVRFTLDGYGDYLMWPVPIPAVNTHWGYQLCGENYTSFVSMLLMAEGCLLSPSSNFHFGHFHMINDCKFKIVMHIQHGCILIGRHKMYLGLNSLMSLPTKSLSALTLIWDDGADGGTDQTLLSTNVA